MLQSGLLNGNSKLRSGALGRARRPFAGSRPDRRPTGRLAAQPMKEVRDPHSCTPQQSRALVGGIDSAGIGVCRSCSSSSTGRRCPSSKQRTR